MRRKEKVEKSFILSSLMFYFTKDGKKLIYLWDLMEKVIEF